MILGIAGRLERLRYTDPETTTLDAGRLRRWQSVYSDEVVTVLQNLAVLMDQPATVSADDLVKWIAYARKTLTSNPPDGQS
ncbi:hypothetical protein [Streptacidiphilus neutrinimicus]|uniref:hypothetical protein n=1 Tax=Streptacidiphilus neutrinimicus TaxID=105420 RepID=UPI0005A94FF1|nr:hypothetical protein [Streptacidiphilus neutrinimicus]